MIYLSVAFANCFTISVFPVPGARCNKTAIPLGRPNLLVLSVFH